MSVCWGYPACHRAVVRQGSETVGAEARSFLSTRYHRLWGITAARAAARLRLSRMRYIGLSREEVERLRSAPRPPAAGRSAEDGWHRADVHVFEEQHGAGAPRLGGLGD